MGEMADIALEHCAMWESLADDYVAGDMSTEDAFEHGFLDSSGVEDPGSQAAWDRAPLGGIDTLNNELRHAEADLNAYMHMRSVPIVQKRKPILNNAAIANLSKPNPTCNICAEQMTARNGKFGKFYCCANRCEGQGTVSDKYWQSVRAK